MNANASSIIRQPTVNPSQKQDADETVEVPPSSQHEGKKKWLAGLSHDELLSVAHGAVWQAEGLHSQNCFNCKKPGTLLECHDCPRSYHRRCLDPPIHGNFKIDQPWYCPNCTLLQLETDKRTPPGILLLGSDQGKSLAQQPPLKASEVISLRRSSESNDSKITSKVTSPLRNQTPPPEIQNRPHKRSRYATLPDHIDEAFGLLNRELESAYQSKNMVRDLSLKIHILEQDLKIRKGEEVLIARDQRRELNPEKELIETLKTEIDVLRSENSELREEVERIRAEARRKDHEVEEWRKSMRVLIDGK